MLEPEEIVLRVKRGSTLLDERVPGWAQQVRLDELHMASGLRCILGQVYGEYTVGLAALNFGVDSREAVTHGFVITPSKEEGWWIKGYNALKAEWALAVRERVDG